MFKKLFNILIIVTIIISTTGFTISKHYCSGSLISVSVLSEAETCCKTGDCCNDESTSVEPINDFVTTAVSFEFFENFDFNIIDFAIVLINYEFNFNTPEKYSKIGFSPYKPMSIFSLIRVFRL